MREPDKHEWSVSSAIAFVSRQQREGASRYPDWWGHPERLPKDPPYRIAARLGETV